MPVTRDIATAGADRTITALEVAFSTLEKAVDEACLIWWKKRFQCID